MANMSYCRFQNTHYDFADCVDALMEDGLVFLSDRERRSADALYELAKQYIEAYELAADIV